jgi:DNA-binding MarR family transcriptional regulator
MSKNISKEKVVNDLYLFLRTIYHYERNIAAQFGLNYQEIYLLQNLRRTSPQRLTEIAKTLEVPMFTASRLVGRLVQEKFISKEKGSLDRRSISITLLPRGEEVVGAVESQCYTSILQNTAEMSKEDVESLLRMAEKMYEVLGIPLDRIQ